MKSKTAFSILFAAVIAVCSLSLAACGNKNSVAGKTFVFESVEIASYGESSETDKKDADEQLAYEKTHFVGATFKFSEDGEITLKRNGETFSGKYKQKGNVITGSISILNITITLDGDKFTYEEPFGEASFRYTYKEKA